VAHGRAEEGRGSPPSPLGRLSLDHLDRDGFRIAGTERGIETVLADSANLVTVLVGSHEISRFVGHLWAAARRHRNSPSPGVKLIVEQDGRRIALTLEHEGFSDDGPPEKVVRGMTALLKNLPDRETEGRRG
jgi:hypothetical protein